jgi:hypothetical protein
MAKRLSVLKRPTLKRSTDRFSARNFGIPRKFAPTQDRCTIGPAFDELAGSGAPALDPPAAGFAPGLRNCREVRQHREHERSEELTACVR